MRAGGCAYWTNVQLLHPARELAGLNLAASEPTMVRFLEGHVAAEDLAARPHLWEEFRVCRAGITINTSVLGHASPQRRR
jgi:hypothetical protein